MKVSVILCTHIGTDADLLKQSIACLKRQTISFFELVVYVDGEVSDRVEELLEEARTTSDSKINVVQIRGIKNCGHGEARRRAIENASGDIIVINDSDDLSHPWRLEVMRDTFKRDQGIDVITTRVIEADLLRGRYLSTREVPSDQESSIHSLVSRCSLNHNSCALRKSSVLERGGYISWFCNEDYFLWIRLFM